MFASSSTPVSTRYLIVGLIPTNTVPKLTDCVGSSLVLIVVFLVFSVLVPTIASGADLCDTNNFPVVKAHADLLKSPSNPFRRQHLSDQKDNVSQPSKAATPVKDEPARGAKSNPFRKSDQTVGLRQSSAIVFTSATDLSLGSKQTTKSTQDFSAVCSPDNPFKQRPEPLEHLAINRSAAYPAESFAKISPEFPQASTASVALASDQSLPQLPACKTYDLLQSSLSRSGGEKFFNQPSAQVIQNVRWEDSLAVVGDKKDTDADEENEEEDEEEEVALGTSEIPGSRGEKGNSAFDNTMINRLSVDIRPRKADTKDSSDKKNTPGSELATKIPENLAANKLGDYQEAEIQLPGMGRGLAGREFAWAAPSFYHRPLYYEQHNLERYGHFYGGACLQSAICTAHFFATVPVMPYKVATQSPNECVYTLGNYRPGNCNPNYWTRCKLSTRGFVTQAVATTGWAFLLF